MRNLLKNLRTSKKGFTYVELIIVVAIFSIITVIVGSTFILFSKAEATTSINERLLADGRYLLETMVRSIRTNKVDYSLYTSPIINPVDYISVRNSENNLIEFRYEESDCPNEIIGCLIMNHLDGTGTLSGKNMNVDYAKFYVTPVLNPFEVTESGDYASNEQPSIMILLGISSTQETPNGEPVRIQLQTTISTKAYER